MGGTSDIPMIEIRDSLRCAIEHLRFEGNATNPPLAAIRYKWLTGDAQAGNHFHSLNRVLINSQDGVSGSSFRYGVIFDGDNGANDAFRFENLQITNISDTCIYLPNTQSVTGSISDTWFQGRGISTGISTASNIALYNVFFDQCACDIKASSTAQVDAFGWSSENSKLIGWGAGVSGCRINVNGGYWLTGSVLNNTFLQHDCTGEGGGLSIKNVKISTDNTKKIVATGISGASRIGCITVENSRLLISALDITAAATGAGIQIDFVEAGRNIHATLSASRKFLGANDPGTTPQIGWMRVAGQYVGPSRNTPTSTLMVPNVEYAVPIAISDSGTWDLLAAAVTAAGDAGSVIRLGVRKSNGVQPGGLYFDAGTVPGDAIATVTKNLTLDITPGLWWLTATAQNVTTNAPRMNMISSPAAPIVGWTTVAGALGNSPATAGYKTSATVTGTLPDNYSVSDVSTVPLIVARWS